MKRTSLPRPHRLLLSVLALGLFPAAASAQVLARPVLGPTVIDRPGSYILLRNISSSGPGAAIHIVASNVTFDLNGHTISGPGNKQGTGVRVTGAGGVRIHNGIVSRFGVGVEVTGSHNVRVQGLHVDGEDLGGPPPGEVGILIVNSRAVFAERNVVSRTFLGFFIRGTRSAANRIAENTLAGGAHGQLGICYNPDGSGDPDGPTGDLVYNNLVSRFQVGIQTSAGTSGNIFRENDIAYVLQDIEEVTPGSNVFVENTSVQIGL